MPQIKITHCKIWVGGGKVPRRIKHNQNVRIYLSDETISKPLWYIEFVVNHLRPYVHFTKYSKITLPPSTKIKYVPLWVRKQKKVLIAQRLEQTALDT